MAICAEPPVKPPKVKPGRGRRDDGITVLIAGYYNPSLGELIAEEIATKLAFTHVKLVLSFGGDHSSAGKEAADKLNAQHRVAKCHHLVGLSVDIVYEVGVITGVCEPYYRVRSRATVIPVRV